MARLRLVHSRPPKSSAGSDLAIALPFLLVLALAVIAGLGAARAAEAIEVGDAAVLQNGLQRDSKSAQARVELKGLLSCNMGAKNTGEPCQMKFKDTISGKLYKLSGAGEAQSLFHSGRKSVALEGSLTDPETIEVWKLKSL